MLIPLLTFQAALTAAPNVSNPDVKTSESPVQNADAGLPALSGGIAPAEGVLDGTRGPRNDAPSTSEAAPEGTTVAPPEDTGRDAGSPPSNADPVGSEATGTAKAPGAAPKPAAAPQQPTPVPSLEAVSRDSTVDLGRKQRRDRFKRPGSPQRFALEFKLGPYLPDIDKDYAGPGLGPYAQVFGRTDSNGRAIDEPKLGIMPVLGFEWQFWYLAGPLALGTQVGFFRDTANALFAAPSADGSLRSAADETAFGMVPISLLFIYRFELPADRWRVPLVPYAKAGPNYAFWWTTGGDGSISRNARGERGVGGIWGWQVDAGLMLRLDFLEPGTAKKFDQASGVNHTYLFGEFHYAQIDNFGVGRSMNLGDLTGYAGLAIEF